MTTRKEERERLRQERLAAQQAASRSERQRLYVGYALAGVIVVAILAGIVVAITGSGDESGEGSSSDYPELSHIQPMLGVVPDDVEPDGREGTPPPEVENGDLEAAAEAAGCDLRLDLPEEGFDHFADENREVDYETNPPTSGDHYGNPSETVSGALADGAYLQMPPITRAVHSLEHGRVEIQYSPDLSEAEQLEIKGVFDESPFGVILFPNPDMPYDVAATAWRNLVGCDQYQGAATLDVLRAFRDIYRGTAGRENVPLTVGG
jgi:hypothetical protein